MFPYLKFRLQRAARRVRRDLWQWRRWSVAYLQQHVWGKWRQLGLVRRLALAWWSVIGLSVIVVTAQITGLGKFYLVTQPLSGGVYAEGEVGQVTNINPILPEPGPAADVSRLIFNGLTRVNPKRQLEGDLATSWDISQDGRTYTFHLRHDVKWQDGVPFTARDVVFTLVAIQNPDTRSPLANSWQGVKADAKDNYTVVFTLPSPYSPFIYSTTVGILPSHILEATDPATLRVADFNQKPVGTGPFKLHSFLPAEGEIQLDANPSYYRGRPRLDGFIFRLYGDQRQLEEAYAKHQVNALARLQPNSARDSRFDGLKRDRFGLTDQMVLFFRTPQAVLKDKTVRRALAAAIDRQKVLEQAAQGYGTVMKLPLLPGSLGYTTAALPPSYDRAAALVQLAQAGWTRGKDGKLANAGQPMVLKLLTGNTPELAAAADSIKQQLSQLGIGINVVSVDLTELQQSYIRPRNYDLLLFGINLGADPDQYAYWHSSQADDPGLNLSQWNDPAADKALESGRISSDADVRTGKYHSFLKTWADDTPAVVLYSPVYVYATSPDARGITAQLLIDPADRFYDIEKWTILARKVPRL